MDKKEQLALLINVQHGRMNGFNANMLAPSLRALKEKHKNIESFKTAKYTILQNDYDVTDHAGYKQNWDEKVVHKEMQIRKELENKIISIYKEVIKSRLEWSIEKYRSLLQDLHIVVSEYKPFGNLMVLEDKNTPLLNNYPDNELIKGREILTLNPKGEFENQRIKFIDNIDKKPWISKIRYVRNNLYRS